MSYRYKLISGRNLLMSDNSKKTFKGELCQSLDPGDLYEVFFAKQFSGNITISMRPLSLPGDDLLLRDLAALELPERKEMAEMPGRP